MIRMVRIVLLIAVVAALALPVAAQQANQQSASNPLVQLLQSKGILSADEAASVRTASTSAEANERLARLLWSKGLISQEEYNSTVAAAAVSAASNGSAGAHMVNAAAPSAAAAAPAAVEPAPAGRAATRSTNEFNYASLNSVGYDPLDGASADAGVIPAIAPVRVLPITLPRDPKGIIPDIKLGGGAMINPYGFFKASAVYDTTNSGGATFGNNDFPLPLLLNGDTGPSSDQFRVKARSARMGANVYYPINGPDVILTGKIEFDWEGDYTAVDNRNVSSIRSSQASLRLAYARIDAKWADTPVYAEFGVDWTLLGSSTVMDLFETTGFGVFFGNFYERDPQFKIGTQFKAGSVKIVPEFAIVLPAFADSNLNNSTAATVLGATGAVPTGFQNQTREGAFLGPDSGQPGVQGRIVIDFPLNKDWKGVANSEIIVAGSHEEGREIVPFGNIPSTSLLNAALPAGVTSFACASGPEAGDATTSLRGCYPHGFTMDIPQNAFDVEFQLPTPWITLVGKYYRGSDLRFMFGGQGNSVFSDLMGMTTIAPPPTVVLTCVATAPAGTAANANCPAATPFIGSSTVAQNVYALNGDAISFVRSAPVAGVSSIQFAPYRPVRGYGGLIQAGFPLSRIFGANPEGLNRGWTLYMAYGFDGALNRDTVRPGANGLRRSDYVPISLRYQVNKWMQFVNEVTWYDSRLGTCTELTASTSCVNGLGLPLQTSLTAPGFAVNGFGAHINHDIREEFGTVLTF